MFEKRKIVSNSTFDKTRNGGDRGGPIVAATLGNRICIVNIYTKVKFRNSCYGFPVFDNVSSLVYDCLTI